MSDRTKIVMVNYLNSMPFELGLNENQASVDFEIIKATPAKCADIFRNGEADIALIPVGALQDMDDFKIVSDFAIACDGEVRTVCIFSNQDIKTCHKLYLDDHSRTSFLLSKILLEQYLHLNIEYVKADVASITLDIGEAKLMIGDKVFGHENDYTFKYDLGIMWKEWTTLPFVFAVWIAKKDLDSTIENVLNDALEYGIDHIDEIIDRESSENLDLYFYFHNNIHYHMDEQKRAGLELYLHKIRSLEHKSLSIN